jgi:hypothetical protein
MSIYSRRVHDIWRWWGPIWWHHWLKESIDKKVITKIAVNFPSEENPWSQKKVNFFVQVHLTITLIVTSTALISVVHLVQIYFQNGKVST